MSSYVGDILDSAFVERVFSMQPFDVVIHLAAITEHDAIVNDKQRTFETNLMGTLSLLKGFNAHCKGAQFIYASTGKVYGKTDEMPITESARSNPQNILGRSKRITEQTIEYCAIPDNNYLICRIFNIYGEHQKRNFVVPTIIDQLNDSRVKLGNICDLRDYLYIEDLISAITACIRHRDKFAQVDYVNIGSGTPTSVSDILRELEQLTGKSIAVETEARRFRADETPIEVCDNHRLTTLTGWKPKYSLREGLYQTLRGEGVLP